MSLTLISTPTDIFLNAGSFPYLNVYSKREESPPVLRFPSSWSLSVLYVGKVGKFGKGGS